ncbi:hypothetical protein KDA82_30970 [Streptomyces daliensis]|uniref:Uncharacterized protein n=1 Tax=Streptomyces daliensis TaxID=299421 RepID=A0A8T4J4Y6_9ACTN|nr:hypothetical protein [Streptomyces daliensis]
MRIENGIPQYKNSRGNWDVKPVEEQNEAELEKTIEWQKGELKRRELATKPKSERIKAAVAGLDPRQYKRIGFTDRIPDPSNGDPTNAVTLAALNHALGHKPGYGITSLDQKVKLTPKQEEKFKKFLSDRFVPFYSTNKSQHMSDITAANKLTSLTQERSVKDIASVIKKGGPGNDVGLQKNMLKHFQKEHVKAQERLKRLKKRGKPAKS